MDDEGIKDEIRKDYWDDLEDYQQMFPFHRMGMTVSEKEGEEAFYDHIEDDIS